MSRSIINRGVAITGQGATTLPCRGIAQNSLVLIFATAVALAMAMRQGAETQRISYSNDKNAVVGMSRVNPLPKNSAVNRSLAKKPAKAMLAPATPKPFKATPPAVVQGSTFGGGFFLPREEVIAIVFSGNKDRSFQAILNECGLEIVANEWAVSSTRIEDVVTAPCLSLDDESPITFKRVEQTL